MKSKYQQVKRLIAVSTFALVFSGVPATLVADEKIEGVYSICDEKADTFTIYSFAKTDENSQQTLEGNKSREQLICKLSSGTYQLIGGGEQGSESGVGRCGAFFYWTIEILKNGKSIFKERIVADCHFSKTYIKAVQAIGSQEELIVSRESYIPD